MSFQNDLFSEFNSHGRPKGLIIPVPGMRLCVTVFLQCFCVSVLLCYYYVVMLLCYYYVTECYCVTAELLCFLLL